MPEQPPTPPDGGDDTRRRREGAIATEERKKAVRPDRFKVVLYNDNYTPMEFVISLLEQLFNKGPSEATQLMLQIHKGGKGIAGLYVLEVAETKVARVHRMAEDRGYPLRAGLEAE
jgi:ATP-dependent Clp protease adaptor protein ClpS